MRIFTGFPIEIAAGGSLHAAIKRVRIGAQKHEMEVRWAMEPNYHVTLNFLGEIEAERVEAIKSMMHSAARVLAPVTTSLRGMGGFPDERHARVIWVGVRKSRGLERLQAHLRELFVQADFFQEERPFAPHLTIGRMRKSRSVTDVLSPYVRKSFGDIEVNAITLYESVMHGAQPDYNALARFSLSGEPEPEPEPQNETAD